MDHFPAGNQNPLKRDGLVNTYTENEMPSKPKIL